MFDEVSTFDHLLAIRRKGESLKGRYKKTKQAKYFLPVRVRIRG